MTADLAQRLAQAERQTEKDGRLLSDCANVINKYNAQQQELHKLLTRWEKIAAEQDKKAKFLESRNKDAHMLSDMLDARSASVTYAARAAELRSVLSVES